MSGSTQNTAPGQTERSIRSPAHSRSYRHLSHLFVKAVKALELIQAYDSPAIFDPVAVEIRQDLNLLPGEKLRRQRLDDGCQIRNSFPPNNPVFIINVFPQGLNNIYQGRLFGLELCRVISH